MEREYINILIKIGESLFLDKTSRYKLTRIDDGYYINYCENWKGDTIKSLDNVELINVFKGLIIAEQCYSQLCGSATVGKHLYNQIQKRGLDNDEQIAVFALRNSNNPYIPFDGVCPMITIDGFLEWKSKKVPPEWYIKNLQRVEGRRIKRQTAIAELRKLSKEQRGEVREKLLDKYRNATINEKLEIVANDKIFPPEYYPIEWIKITEVEISNLPIELIKKLYDKLSTKTKGEWKRFAQNLRKFDNEK